MKKLVFLTIVVIVTTVMVVNLGAFMAGNESETAFVDPVPDTTGEGAKEGASLTLGQLIAAGGGYFLKSGSELQAFLSGVEFSEVSGVEFKALQEKLDAAIVNMENARASYLQLKNLAAVTPYNPAVISRLMDFDYDNFQENNRNGLIPAVFGKVKALLGAGSVRGVYNEFYTNSGLILELLYTLKKDVDAGIFPELSTLWHVNQTYGEAQLFGQYVAEVFYSLK